MQFKIPCEIYARMRHAAIPAYGGEDKRMWLRSVFVVHDKGQVYVITSNAKIMAIQHVDKTDQPDGCVNLVISDALIDQCKIEAPYNSDLIIDVTDTEYFKYAAASTTFGYKYPDNAGMFPAEDMSDQDIMTWKKWRRGEWRTLIPSETPKKSNGFLFMDTDLLVNLGLSAPSRRLVFPEIIATDIPVIVRDAVDPSWMGVFISYTISRGKGLTPAIRPEWL